VIYLYAVVEPGAEAPSAPGLDDQPLEVIEAGEVAALVSAHEWRSFDPDPDTLWRHDRVVEQAMAAGPVLPARFGSTFVDAPGVADALGRNPAELRRALDGVRGCVELAVRVSSPRSVSPPARDGREYLEARLLEDRESRAAAQALEPLAAHAVRSERRPAPGDSTTLTASYLVRADEVSRFAERVRQLAEVHPELSLSCTGPWPPYSFVGEEAL
jgi:Gas vesicle synthesis protein GvpL/GvpF